MRPAGRKTRNGNHVSGESIANVFVPCFSEVNGIQTEGSERLDVEASKECLCLAACASQRTAQSRGDDTHAVVKRPKGAQQSVVPFVGGLQA